jgi:hypothetical protein
MGSISEISQAVMELERRWPAWQVWTVHRAVSRPPTLWCAKRWDDTGPVLNCDSAGELSAAIEQEQQEG